MRPLQPTLSQGAVVGHEDLRLWGVWPPGPVADSGRRVLVAPARSPSRRGMTAAVVVAVSAALVQQACVPASCAARVVYPVAPPLSSRLTTVIGAGGSGGGSHVEVQLVGRLQAVRAEPHDFLPGLATAPAMMLRIGQTTTCLPVVGRPRRRHLMLALQATQRNPEPRILAMGYGPVAHCRRADVCSGVGGLPPPLKAIGWIEQNAHGTTCPVQPRLGETVLPIVTQVRTYWSRTCSSTQSRGRWLRRPRAWMPLPVWEIWGAGRSPALRPKPEPAQVEAQ